MVAYLFANFCAFWLILFMTGISPLCVFLNLQPKQQFEAVTGEDIVFHCCQGFLWQLRAWDSAGNGNRVTH